MNQKDKEAFEKWFISCSDSSFAVFLRENYPEIGIKWDIEPARSAWQAACEYKQKEVDELEKEQVRHIDILKDELNTIIKSLQAENAKLRECVEFYADRENWSFDDVASESVHNMNGGKRARQVLKELDSNKQGQTK